MIVSQPSLAAPGLLVLAYTIRCQGEEMVGRPLAYIIIQFTRIVYGTRKPAQRDVCFASDLRRPHNHGFTSRSRPNLADIETPPRALGETLNAAGSQSGHGWLPAGMFAPFLVFSSIGFRGGDTTPICIR